MLSRWEDSVGLAEVTCTSSVMSKEAKVLWWLEAVREVTCPSSVMSKEAEVLWWLEAER